MNIYEQEIVAVVERLAEKSAYGGVLTVEEILELTQLIDIRTSLLFQLRDQVILSQNVIQELSAELENADLAMEDMDDFIGKLRYTLDSAR